MYHYTYHLFNYITQQHYYGVRSSKILPEEDLFLKYFSSSKLVRNFIASYGKESFKVTIRRTFSSRQKSMLWEEKVLRRLKVCKRADWLNNNVAGYKFGSYGLIQSEETKAKKVEKANSFYSSLTEEQRKERCKRVREGQRKINYNNATFKGKKHTEESKLKMIKAKGTCINFQGKAYYSYSEARRETGRAISYIKKHLDS